MQQEFLTHKTGSLSKILMGTAMIGFFGIFSPNTAATAVDCHHFYEHHDCESHSICQWVPYGPDCIGGKQCHGLSEETCGQTAGCSMTYPGPDMGMCIENHHR